MQHKTSPIPVTSKHYDATTATRSVAAATFGLVLAFSATNQAKAVPAYGYALLSFSNFTLSGVIGTAGVTVNSANIQTSDSANYPNAPSISQNSAGYLVTGSDVTQATPPWA